MAESTEEIRLLRLAWNQEHDKVLKLETISSELLTTLKKAEAQIIYLHGKFKETGSGNRTLAQIQDTIEKAEAKL